MPIDSISAVAGSSTTSTTTATRTPKQEMDGALFMNLLVTQLQNQDPSSPMDTTQMINQTTQLAMMEKLNSLDSTGTEDFSLQMRIAAASLIGRNVSYTGADGTEVTGVASAVSYAGSVPQMTVDGKTVSLDTLSGVSTS
ncbi:MAG: flagellar hook capping protein [Micrococcaceae bacterium]|nr:flagellar hook capping protein [Micrococcaceae bacterium]